MGNYEQQVQQGLFANNGEKTYIDKVLSRQDINEMRKLMKKDKLERQEVIDLLYLLSSSESKLLNHTSWERYVVLKFFVWIRDFVKTIEQLFDYMNDLEKKESEKKITISDETKKILLNCERLIQHDSKFLVDLYLNIVRSSLSVNGYAFDQLLKNKVEMLYPNGMPVAGMQMQGQAQQQPQRKGLGLFR